MLKKWRTYKLGFCIFITIFLLTCPLRFANHYYAIDHSEMLDTSLINRSEFLNQIYLAYKLPDCEYDILIKKNLRYHKRKLYLPTIYRAEEILNGGEYNPMHCEARYSVAIIVPYRNRELQLKHFVNYMHNFLRNQNIHYKIIVVEQTDDGPFNRGMLLNIGARQAIKEKFPCLIFHDIDSLPTSLGNLYVCNKNPRHFGVSVDKYRFNLPYVTFFGVVCAIDSQSFLRINGLSNRFNGWGSEDDDLYMRLYMERIPVVRFERDYSEYVTLNHRQARATVNRFYKLYFEFFNYKLDGLNSLLFTHLATIEYNLFTLIMIGNSEK